jgi:hypothetical protein
MMRITIRVLSLAALALSAAWFYASPDYEPAITFLFGLAGFLGSIFVHPHGSGIGPKDLSPKAQEILRIAASGNGNIAVFNHPNKKFVDAAVNSPQHVHLQGDTPREQAEYVGAVEELEQLDLVVFESGSLWRVTPQGFQTADKMS